MEPIRRLPRHLIGRLRATPFGARLAVASRPPRRWGAGARRAALRFARHWRRSLQLRVVGSTLAASLVVVMLLGWFLIARIEDGLLQSKIRAATEEAWAGTSQVQEQIVLLQASDPKGYDPQARAFESLQRSVVEDLGSRGDGERYAVILDDQTADSPYADARTTGEVLKESVPARLADRLARSDRLQQRWTYTEIRYEGGRRQAGLIVGTRVGPWLLYYVFPLDQEQATLDLVQRTVAIVGGGLVLLLCGIAYLVTRQVVSPVRMAARIAQRLESGELHERMHVRGEDDLARLASSFNSMAAGLQAQIERLEELSRVQRQFVSDVSHELRTPLTTVRMAADVLYEGRDRLHGDTARAAELLQNQLDRFESLLADLLEISRHDAGAADLDATPNDLRDLARSAVESAEPFSSRSGSVVHLDVPGVPCVAEVDPRRIDRILRNLIVNAIEHGEGRPIEVRVGADDDAVAVVVRDHGIGLTPEHAARVFDRFWRADPARVRGVGGTGLGLAIALEDAHLHGGWLQAAGVIGAGSAFRLTVPRSADVELRRSPLPLGPGPGPDGEGTGDGTGDESRGVPGDPAADAGRPGGRGDGADPAPDAAGDGAARREQAVTGG